MKKKSLNLGKELSKNSQKKVLGGAWIHCSDGSYYTSSCSPGHQAYCAAAQHGQYQGCSS